MKPRENPFASHLIGEMPYSFSPGERELLLKRLEQNKWRGAIVGPHGSGKSTLVSTLISELSELGFACLRYELKKNADWKPALHLPIPERRSNTILFLDGAEQIPALVWPLVQLKLARAAGLIVTTHKPGRLKTVFQCIPSREMLANLIATLSHEPAPSFVDELFLRHNGNLREALREMYDRCAEDNLSWRRSAAVSPTF